MMMNWEHVGTVAAVAGTWLWGAIRREATNAVGYAQKYYSDGHLSDADLEAIAVEELRKHLHLPEWLAGIAEAWLRRQIRKACAIRRARAQKAGLR